MIVSSLVICSQHGLNVQLDAPNPPQVSKAGTGPGAGPLITTPDKIQKQGVVPDEGICAEAGPRDILLAGVSYEALAALQSGRDVAARLLHQ